MISIASFISSLGLIILLAAVLSEVMLAFVVIRSNPKGATNVIFFLLSVFTILWLVAAYIVNLSALYPYAVTLARLGIFFAAPMSSFLFLLAHTIPSEKLQMRFRWFALVLVATAGMMAVNVSPYAFTDATSIVNGSINPVAGPGLLPFSILSTVFSILAIYFLVKKYRQADELARPRIKVVLMGMLVMLALIIATVLVPIIFFHYGAFVVLTPLYTLVFLGATAYSIVRYQLFDLKVIATQGLTGAIWIILLTNIVAASTLIERISDIFVFALTVPLGIVLVRSISGDIRQRV
jgi:hypothetical protein